MKHVFGLKLISALLFFSACTNGQNGPFMGNAKKITQPQNGLLNTLVNGNIDPHSGFGITRIVPNQESPTQYIDVIGDGTGSIGKFCSPQADQKGGVCDCEFEYRTQEGSTEVLRTKVIYQEENLLRCSYQVVPIDAQEAKLTVIQTEADFASNTLTFNPSEGNPSFSTVLENFLEVKRFQCRDITTIASVLDPKMYDPIQSESAYHANFKNYYATNVYQAITTFLSSNSSSSYECPFGNKDEGDADYNVKDGESILGKNELEFHVSRVKNSTYSVPFNSFIAPNILTLEKNSQSSGSAASAPPPLGYLAKPENGACPKNPLSKPSGFKWVKVWRYSANVSTPDKMKLNELVSKIGTNQAIACNVAFNDASFKDKNNLGNLARQESIFGSCQYINNSLPASSILLPEREIFNQGRTLQSATESTLANRVIRISEAIQNGEQATPGPSETPPPSQIDGYCYSLHEKQPTHFSDSSVGAGSIDNLFDSWGRVNGQWFRPIKTAHSCSNTTIDFWNLELTRYCSLSSDPSRGKHSISPIINDKCNNQNQKPIPNSYPYKVQTQNQLADLTDMLYTGNNYNTTGASLLKLKADPVNYCGSHTFSLTDDRYLQEITDRVEVDYLYIVTDENESTARMQNRNYIRYRSMNSSEIITYRLQNDDARIDGPPPFTGGTLYPLCALQKDNTTLEANP